MAQFKKGQSGNPAGRPAKADKFAGQIAKAEARIAKNLVKYIENMEALADGVLVEDVNIITGQKMVYQKPPDRAANEYLINRIMGKPTERQELSTPDGIDVRVQTFERALNTAYADDTNNNPAE